MANLLKRLRISSVDLCRRGANPLAKIALSKSDEDEREDTLEGDEAPEQGDELIRKSCEEAAKGYTDVLKGDAVGVLMRMKRAGDDAYGEYIRVLSELKEAKRVEPLMKEYGTSRSASGTLEARVGEILRAQPDLTRAQAVVRAYERYPDMPEVL